MRRATLLAAVLCLAAPAGAQPGRTKWGVQTGARATTGQLADRYGVGFVLGFESAFMPSWFGVVWAMQYTWFWNRSDPRNVDTMSLIDLDLAARARLSLGSGFPIFVWGQVGIGLVRTSVPSEPALDTGFIGPSCGGGAELAMWSPVILSLAGDYSFYQGGPSGFRMLFSVGVAAH